MPAVIVGNQVAVMLYDASGNPMFVANGAVVPTSGVVMAGSDGTNARFIRTAADGTQRVDPTGTTTQPVSGTVTANQGTAAALASAWPFKLTDGTNVMPTADAAARAIFSKVTDGTNVMPTMDVSGRAGFTQNAAASQVDGHSASIGTTTDPDTSLTVIGRLKQIITKLAAGLPAALVGGRLDQNMGSWLGSTVPTVGQKTMAQSIPVCMPTDQTAVLVTFTGTRTGVVGAIISLGGSTANILQIMRATAYTEQASQAQRSFKSDNVNDTSAGTGARSVKFIYYNNAGAGPFTETVVLNGTTAVATVATDIRFIESMEVVTAGSTGANVGTITMFVNNSGGGGAIGSIGISAIVTGAGDNKTLWAHHYVAAGVTASLSTLIVGAQSGGSGTSARFFLKAQSVLTANAAETLVGDVLLVQGAFSRLFNFYVKVPGFARLTAYGVPAVNNATLSAAFDYSET